MSVNRMKKRILLLLLVIPALIKAQDVMTETRQELTSPDGAYRFTFYQRAVGEDNTQMYYTLTYKNRPVIEESKLGVLIENQLFESALGIPNDTCHFCGLCLIRLLHCPALCLNMLVLYLHVHPVHLCLFYSICFHRILHHMLILYVFLQQLLLLLKFL